MGAILGIGLIIGFVIGMPIAFALGASSALALILKGQPIILIAQRMFTGIDSFPYMALPFFILAGNLMSNGGISKRLIYFCTTMIGRIRGGLAYVAILSSMFFAAISGSSAATAAAVGAIMIPGMLEKGYDRDFSAATVASAAAVGIIIPPSVPMVLYCVAAGASVGNMFIGGIIPGFMYGGILIIIAYFLVRKQPSVESRKYTWKEKMIGFRDSIIALLMPVIILGGIYSGVFTPTEAAAVAVVYGLIVGLFIYKEIKIGDLGRIFLESTLTAATILIIISTASLFGLIITREQVPQLLANVFAVISPNKYVFLVLVNILFLIVGMFMESSAAIIILTPLLAPIATSFGIDLLQFGIIMVVNLAIGMVTPPVGLNLFVIGDIAQTSIGNMMKHLMPYIIGLILILLLISFIPQTCLYLPSLMQR